MPTHARLLLVVTLCCSLVARAVAFASTETKAAANADAGAAPPPSPVVRVAQKHRYLLYDVIFHEQVNKQRRALMFYLDLAMKLKRTSSSRAHACCGRLDMVSTLTQMQIMLDGASSTT